MEIEEYVNNNQGRISLAIIKKPSTDAFIGGKWNPFFVLPLNEGYDKEEVRRRLEEELKAYWA